MDYGYMPIFLLDSLYQNFLLGFFFKSIFKFEEAISEFREELVFSKILGGAVSKFKAHL